MGFTKLGLFLLALTTSTWSRSITEHRNERDKDAETPVNSLRMYTNEKINDSVTSLTLESGATSEEYYEKFRENYAKNEAKKFVRKRALMDERRRRRSLRINEAKADVTFGTRRLEKMLEKAILKIITGDLSTADMVLLKSLNYSLEDVLTVREHELGRKYNYPKSLDNIERARIFHEERTNDYSLMSGESLTDGSRANLVETDEDRGSNKRGKSFGTMASGSLSKKKSFEGDFDFDAYNRQAIYDYENGINSRMSQRSELSGSSGDDDNRSSEKIEVTDVTDVEEASSRDNDRRAESHVIFKIRYDDSDLDSNSEERVEESLGERVERVTMKNRVNNDYRETNDTNVGVTPLINEISSLSSTAIIVRLTADNDNETFRGSTVDAPSSLPVLRRFDDSFTARYDSNARESIDDKPIVNNDNASLVEIESSENQEIFVSTTSHDDIIETSNNETDTSVYNETLDERRSKSVYEGLEWIEDDVYRVIPEAFRSFNYYDGSVNEMDNDTIEDSRDNGTSLIEIERKSYDDDDDGTVDGNNDTFGYQNDNPEDETETQTEGVYSSMRNSPNVNLSTYEELVLAHRRDGNVTSPFDSQGQKAIEDIKLKVLAMTGRFNLSSSGNQVQRERLAMFSPICQPPRNTDAETWSDPILMNMYFQLNLTSGDHVVAAKVRIYALPQDNITISNGGTGEEEVEEEKKIRISIYFYTKSLKKHRSKKRLIDSVVISLTTQGSHWALDVRQALRFWRQNSRNSHGISNNHGLVIQVEDQDGRSLKPSQYIQQDLCHTSELNDDQKASQISESLHSSFKPVLVMFVS